MAPLFDDAEEKCSRIPPSEDLLRLQAARDAAVKAAREAVRDSTRLTRLLAVLNDSGPVNTLLDRAISTLSELFSVDIVVLLDPVGTGNFVPLAAIGLPDPMSEQPFSNREDGCIRRIMDNGEPLFIVDATTDPCIDTQLRDVGAECVIGLPVDGSELTRGVLLLARCRPTPFGAEEAALLRTMSYRIGRTLIEAQRGAQLEMLLRSGRELSRRLELPEVAAGAVQILPSIVRADAAAMLLRDAKGTLYTAAKNGLDDTANEALHSVAEALMSTSNFVDAEPFCTSDLRTTTSALSLTQSDLSPMRAVLGMPIYRDTYLLGVLLCTRFKDIAFNAGALQAAVLFGEQVTAAVENAGLYQAIRSELKERKRLEAEQRKWERQQRQIQKASSLSSMAGAVAHHFNNQLCVVMGSLELAIQEIPKHSELESILTDGMDAAQKAAEVSRSMLTYIGQTGGVRKPLDLSRICRLSLPLLKTATPEGIVLKAEFSTPGPTVKGDGNQIQQVLTQLVTNAWESILSASGTIGIRLFLQPSREISSTNRFPVDYEPDAAEYAVIEVSDTGCGIADSDVDRLFDPFFSTKFPGRGLGLAVVLGIVKAHGGVVTLETVKGDGSTFRVFLPVCGEPILHPAETADRPLPKSIQGSGVLLVDDDQAVRNVTSRTLTRLGFKVYTASDGVAALSTFTGRSAEIHCVVCDLSMPRMNGWETVSSLRRISPDIPFVLISGHDEAKVNADRLSQALPMPVFLHKPFQHTELKDALLTAMTKALDG